MLSRVSYIKLRKNNIWLSLWFATFQNLKKPIHQFIYLTEMCSFFLSKMFMISGSQHSISGKWFWCVQKFAHLVLGRTNSKLLKDPVASVYARIQIRSLQIKTPSLNLNRRGSLRRGTKSLPPSALRVCRTVSAEYPVSTRTRAVGFETGKRAWAAYLCGIQMKRCYG